MTTKIEVAVTLTAYYEFDADNLPAFMTSEGMAKAMGEALDGGSPVRSFHDLNSALEMEPSEVSVEAVKAG